VCPRLWKGCCSFVNRGMADARFYILSLQTQHHPDLEPHC